MHNAPPRRIFNLFFVLRSAIDVRTARTLTHCSARFSSWITRPLKACIVPTLRASSSLSIIRILIIGSRLKLSVWTHNSKDVGHFSHDHYRLQSIYG